MIRQGAQRSVAASESDSLTIQAVRDWVAVALEDLAKVAATAGDTATADVLRRAIGEIQEGPKR
jgi:hypothetical protein